MINDLILTAGPSIGEKELEYGIDAIKNGWNNRHSDYIKKFENTFKNYINTHYSMATSSCTGAMHLALLAYGIKEGDEVIVSEITWIATAAVVRYVGATPIFCDVDKDTWTMCPKSLESKITPRTKAIMPVHIYGHPCEMEPIWDLAKKHNLIVIEDAAQSIGAEYKGQKTGSLGDAAAFSFQGAKALVTGEGGMFLCKTAEIFERARFKGDHGRDPNKALFNIEIGYKYKMSNLQAAIGLAQIERVEEIVAKKRQIFSWYYDRLKDLEEISLNAQKPWAKNIYWMSSIVLSDKIKFSRDEFMKKLKAQNIDSRPIFYPISSFPMFEAQDNPNAYFVGHRGINLPSGHERTETEIDYICCNIKEILGHKVNRPFVSGWLEYREKVISVIKDIKFRGCELTFEWEKEIFSLVAIDKSFINNKDALNKLMLWRKNNQHGFLDTFNVTLESTLSWLINMVENQNDRVLFFIRNNKGELIGHVGLFRFNWQQQWCEIDNIVKGEAGRYKGIMFAACQKLMDWASKSFDINNFYLKVLSNNDKALSLYRRLGFEEINRQALYQEKLGEGCYSYKPLFLTDYEKVENYLIVMKKMDKTL